MYRLPDFHILFDYYSADNAVPPNITMVSAGLSCQLIGEGGVYVIIKCPRHTGLTIEQVPGVIDYWLANIPAGSNDYFEVSAYAPVALGYPNAYESYYAQYVFPPSVLPHP